MILDIFIKVFIFLKIIRLKNIPTLLEDLRETPYLFIENGVIFIMRKE